MVANLDFIEYWILEDGTCFYCGRDAEWIEVEYGGGYLTCVACDSYNDDLEMGIDDDTLLIVPDGENNLNVYF